MWKFRNTTGTIATLQTWQGLPVADNEHVGGLVDTRAVADLWAAHGSRLPAARRLEIVEAVKRRLEGEDGGAADVDVVLEESDALRDALRSHLDAVLPPEALVEARLRVGIAVADLVARTASRRLAALEETALADPLTGLGNRRAAAGAFDAALASARRHDTPVAVALVDLDGLKRLNDEQGHAAGDAALVALATALRQSMRADDSAFRFGGDEFVVLAPVSTAADLARLFDRVREVAPAFSVGIAEAPRDGMTQDALVAVADERMYAHRHAAGVLPAGQPDRARRLATIGVGVLAALLAVVGPVLAWTAQPDRDGRSATGTSTTASTTTSAPPPPTTSGFVGAAGGAEPMTTTITPVTRAIAPRPTISTTTAAPTSTSTSTTATTATTVAVVEAASGGRGRKPERAEKPGNPRAAERRGKR